MLKKHFSVVVYLGKGDSMIVEKQVCILMDWQKEQVKKYEKEIRYQTKKVLSSFIFTQIFVPYFCESKKTSSDSKQWWICGMAYGNINWASNILSNS